MEVRERLDSELGVTAWLVLPGLAPTPVPEAEPDAPSWWHGDDEAAAPFLAWAKTQGWTGEAQ